MVGVISGFYNISLIFWLLSRNAAVNIHVLIFGLDECSHFLGCDLGVELLGHVVALCFNIFEAVLTGFPKWPDQFSLLPARCKASVIFSVLLVIIVPLDKETVWTSLYSNLRLPPSSVSLIFMSPLEANTTQPLSLWLCRKF